MTDQQRDLARRTQTAWLSWYLAPSPYRLRKARRLQAELDADDGGSVARQAEFAGVGR